MPTACHRRTHSDSRAATRAARPPLRPAPTRACNAVELANSACAAGITVAFRSEYNSWKSMRQRCRNPKAASYRYYGAKGIKVCDRWEKSFASFLADMGQRPGPGYSIERLNSHGDYMPGNCVWATAKTQARNRPDYNRLVTFDGKTKCLVEWSELTGISASTIRERIQRFNWTPEQALTIQPGLTAQPVRGPCRKGRLPKLPSVGPRKQNLSSGHYGVGFHAATRKWQARITFAGRTHYLGCHRSKGDAIAAVLRKREALQEAVNA